jgi:hypothetical protein
MRTAVPRQDKLSKLVAVFDQFHQELASVEDERAVQLNENWRQVRPRYAQPSGEHPRSALAAGMEQGLRETPMLLKSFNPEVRAKAAKALSAAIRLHYPEFAVKDKERLEKIRARGSIRGENEYYLIRHHIDVLEGNEAPELSEWYALIERFEGAAR